MLPPNFRAIIQAHHGRVRFEVAVVRDGLPSGEADVAASFRQDLRLRFIEQSRSGPAAARNRGGRHASGKFLVFSGDDCKPAATTEWRRAAMWSTRSPQITKNFAAPNKAFEEAGGFDESFRAAAAEDREFCFRWPPAKRPLLNVPEAVMYHSHGMNLPGFLRVRFEYGRGAWRLRRILDKAEGGAIRVEPLRFHRNLKTGGLRVSQPLSLSQAVNTAGFVWERTLAK